MFSRYNKAASSSRRFFVITASAIVIGVAAPMIHAGRTGNGSLPAGPTVAASAASVQLIDEWTGLTDEAHGKWGTLLSEEEKYVRLCDRVMLSIVTLDYSYMGRLVPALRASLSYQSKMLDDIEALNSDREGLLSKISAEAERVGRTGPAAGMRESARNAQASTAAARRAASLFRERLRSEEELAGLLLGFSNRSLAEEEFVSGFTRCRRQSAGAASEMEESYKESLRIDAAMEQIDLNH